MNITKNGWKITFYRLPFPRSRDCVVEKSAEFSRQIQTMFGLVAPRYDFLNRLLSLGLDRHWRKVSVDFLAPSDGERFLDLATGTGDVALEIASRPAKGMHVCGLDFSLPMLLRARKKIRASQRNETIFLQAGSGEDLPFPDNSFDGLICAFGIRNFADVPRGLDEIRRVLKPGGRAVILEFSMPRRGPLGNVYRWYFDCVLPRVGRWVSGHPDAYQYLPRSVAAFPSREEFGEAMGRKGFSSIRLKAMTLGVVTIFLGIKEV